MKSVGMIYRDKEFLSRGFKVCSNVRLKSTYLTANEVRQHFIDYFRDNEHSYIRSSPVRPFSDPTLEFVNAGMNQFKNVFLGLRSPPAPSASNYQKCIRIGGKHNDLEVVGHDSYHHTFFEMLGNWSFGNYFKEKACKLAWALITSPPYSLPPDRLYVTYFGGDSNLFLEPDLETKEIWRKIGVKSDRIIPFGLKDNFWEMGLTGPCGPSTEIHYDHLGTVSRPQFVNGDLIDLTELWNLVFIQFNREGNGSLTPLKERFVDTGMGFERLVALLQSKSSNYDTDLFQPLFNEITNVCKVPQYRGKFSSDDSDKLDTNYRIMADHSRMMTVAIADNIFPYQSQGLRRVMRKSFRIANQLLPKRGLDVVLRLERAVCHSLEDAYPELSHSLKQIEYVTRDEYSLWQYASSCTEKEWQLLMTKNPHLERFTDVVSPGFIAAMKEIDKNNFSGNDFPLDLALILYDRHGLDVSLIDELASMKGVILNVVQLQANISDLKSSRKTALNASFHQDRFSLLNLPPTDDSGRYNYTRTATGEYLVPDLLTNVIALTSDDKMLEQGYRLRDGSDVGVVLNSTNCWSSQKGDTDVGNIELYSEGQMIGRVEFNRVSRMGCHVVHLGTFFSAGGSECVFDNWKGKINVDPFNRLTLMRNVTASHLIARAMQNQYVGHLSFFSNSISGFTVKFIVYDPNVSEAGLVLLEHSVNEMVKKNLPIVVSKITLSELLGNDGINIPTILNRQNDHFPMIRILSNGEDLREISYGPNLLNTGDVQEFSLVDLVFNRKQREVTFKCITGFQVASAFEMTTMLLEELRLLSDNSSILELHSGIAKVKATISSNMVPLCFRIELNHLTIELEKLLKNKKDREKTQSIDEMVKNIDAEKCPYLVRFAGEDCKLEKLTKQCKAVPVMLFAYNRGHLTARCCTPQESRVEADVWMSKVAQVLGTEAQFFIGHDKKRVCGLKPIKMTKKRLEEINSKLETFGKAALTSS